MRLYQRYLLKTFWAALALVLPLLSGVYALVEFFDKLDNVTKAKVPLTYLLKYLSLRLPEILFDLWPLGLGLSALLSFAYLSRGGELLALRTLGFSPRRLVIPYLLAAALLSLFFLVAEELILPEAAYQARFFWETKVSKKEPKGLVLKGKLYFRGVDSFLVGEVVNPDVTFLKDVVYAEIDRDGLPRTIIWAKEARYLEGKWLFYQGILKEPARGKGPTWFRELELRLDFVPETVLVVKRTPRLQHLGDLWRQRAFLRRAELPATYAESELAYRFCYPLLGVFLVLLSLPAILLGRGREPLGKGLSLGVLAILVGMGVFMGGKSLGDAGYLSPLLAQPLGLLLDGLLGLLFLRQVKT